MRVHRKRKSGPDQRLLTAFGSTGNAPESTSPIRTPQLLDTLGGVSQYLTAAQIAKRRGVVVQTVHEQIQWLRKNGYLTATNEVTSAGLRCLSGGLTAPEKLTRLHDLRLLVEILRFRDPHFARRRRSYLEIDNIPSTVKTLRNNEIVRFALDRWRVEVTTRSFILYPPDAWTHDAHEELLRVVLDAKDVIRKLERRFPVVCLEKGEKLNLKIIGTHAALARNALAKIYNRERRQFEVHDREGKLRLIIDNSLHLHEFEAVSPMWATDDEGVTRQFFQDLIEKPTRLSDLNQADQKIAEQLQQLQARLDQTLKVVNTLVDVQQVQVKSEVLTVKNVRDLRDWMGGDDYGA